METRQVALASASNPLYEEGVHAILSCDLQGNLRARVVSLPEKTIKSATGSISANQIIIPAVTGKRLKVLALEVLTSSNVRVTVTLKDGVAGIALRTYTLRAASGEVAAVSNTIGLPAYLFGTSQGKGLEMDFSVAEVVTYNLTYFDDDSV